MESKTYCQVSKEQWTIVLTIIFFEAEFLCWGNRHLRQHRTTTCCTIPAWHCSGLSLTPELSRSLSSVFLKEQMGTSVAECDAWKWEYQEPQLPEGTANHFVCLPNCCTEFIWEFYSHMKNDWMKEAAEWRKCLLRMVYVWNIKQENCFLGA